MTRLMKTSSTALIAVGVATPLWFWWHGVDLTPALAQTPAARATKTADDTSEDANSAVRVTVVQPTVEPLRRVTSQPAHIEPFEQTSLFAKASGFIAEVRAGIGDRVKKDQVLVELSIPEMRAVTIGFNDGNRAEILEGLKPDETVIAESRSPLSPGQPVQATFARSAK